MERRRSYTDCWESALRSTNPQGPRNLWFRGQSPLYVEDGWSVSSKSGKNYLSQVMEYLAFHQHWKKL